MTPLIMTDAEDDMEDEEVWDFVDETPKSPPAPTTIWHEVLQRWVQDREAIGPFAERSH